MKHVATFKTKLDKNDKSPKSTVVTYTFPNTMPPQLISGWVDSANIRLQSQFRRAKKIPQTIAVDAVEFASATGSRSQPVTRESVAAQLATFTPAQIAQIVADASKKETDAKPDAPKSARKNKPRPAAKPTGTVPAAPKSDGDKNDQPEYIDAP